MKDTHKMRHLWFRSLTAAVAIALAGIFLLAASSGVSAQTPGKAMTTPSGLQISDSKVGSGASPKPGQICVMHYTGWLYENGQRARSSTAR
jgi:peptidylprolyl isomerase